MISIAQALKLGKDSFPQHSIAPEGFNVDGHAIDVLNIELILLEVLKKDRVYLRLHSDAVLMDEQFNQFQSMLTRLQQGEPLAYILGYQDFWTLRLKVTSDTLIPRPDTERLVELALGLFDKATHIKALDLGTGSGAIALSLAAERPHWQLTATDFSAGALVVAQQNASDNQLSNVVFKQGSWFAALNGNTRLFELIVSNPPYIDPDDSHLLALSHEPMIALIADQHGLSDIQQIVTTAPQFLKANGWLVLEHGYDQGGQVRQLLLDAGFHQVQTVQDYGNNDRVTLGCLVA